MTPLGRRDAIQGDGVAGVMEGVRGHGRSQAELMTKRIAQCGPTAKSILEKWLPICRKHHSALWPHLALDYSPHATVFVPWPPAPAPPPSWGAPATRSNMVRKNRMK